MISTAAAALLLGVAVLVTPRRRRLAPPAAVRRRLPGKHSGAVLVVGTVVGAAAVTAPAIAVAATLAVLTALARRRRGLRRAAVRREGQDLAAALEVLVGELRIGSHPVRGFAVAAGESTGAVALGFEAVAARTRLGSDAAAGLQMSGRNSAAPQYWSRIAVCWQLAAEQGLPMATLMGAAHRDIAARHRFADRVQASLSGARATAGVLAGLPLLGVLLGHLVGARPLNFLVCEGPWVLAIGVALLCAGITWADHIIDRVAS